jgi:hypothetical protein
LTESDPTLVVDLEALVRSLALPSDPQAAARWRGILDGVLTP